MKLTFITRQQSVNKEILTLYCRITLHRNVCEITLPLKVNDKWEKSRAVLNYIDKVKENLMQLNIRQIYDNKAPSAAQLKQLYLNAQKKVMLSELFVDYIETFLKSKVRSGEVQEDTITVMGDTVNHVKCFLQERCNGVNDIEASSVTKSRISDFEAYLRFHNNQASKHNSVIKYLQRIKRVFSYALNVRENYREDGYSVKRKRQ
jgi:hypothetical protein